jgi:hypothetical protein
LGIESSDTTIPVVAANAGVGIPSLETWNPPEIGNVAIQAFTQSPTAAMAGFLQTV